LIDTHVHLTSRADLDALAANGVTTAIDMASWPAEATAELRAAADTTTFRSAGVPFIGPAGPHSHFGMPPHAVLTDPGAAASGVAQRVADGSDFIKIVTEAPGRGGPTPEAVRAVVVAAHAAGLRVVAHASHIDAFTMSVDAGADIITHVPTETPVPEDIARQMRAQGQIAIPTLTVSELLTSAMPRPGSSYEAARGSVVTMSRVGVRILAGTDSVSGADVPFTIEHGLTLHHELQLLVGAGLTPIEAIHSTTRDAAATFGLHDRGVVRPGGRADLVLVDGDPTNDITDTTKITGVWIAGRRTR
ncbi:MAG: amidohydrolase family protein, partial [Williamsia herbipolensis]|nr:amidohydrolase family protein [Williamsia herbipolensis]